MENERAEPIRTERFEVPFEGTKLVGDIIPAGGKPRILSLHGAGQSTTRRVDFLREPLAADGIASCGFDHIGHGETGGSLLGSTLQNRVEQARAVIDNRRLMAPLSIVGASMGGYEAIKLTDLYEVENLILAVPAAYDVAAYTVPFGPRFSEVLRQPRSWERSDAWEILDRFTGNLLIFQAEHDEVVPNEIIERMYGAATKVKSREVVVAPGSSHQIYSFLAANDFFIEQVYPRVRQLLSEDEQ